MLIWVTELYKQLTLLSSATAGLAGSGRSAHLGDGAGHSGVGREQESGLLREGPEVLLRPPGCGGHFVLGILGPGALEGREGGSRQGRQPRGIISKSSSDIGRSLCPHPRVTYDKFDEQIHTINLMIC